MKSSTLNLKNKKLIVCQAVLSIIILAVAVTINQTIGKTFDGNTNATTPYEAKLDFFSPSESGRGFRQFSVDFVVESTSYRRYRPADVYPPYFRFAFGDSTTASPNSIPIGSSIPVWNNNTDRVYDSFMSRVSQFSLGAIVDSYYRSGYTWNTSSVPSMEKSTNLADTLTAAIRDWNDGCVCDSTSFSSRCYNYRCPPVSDVFRSGIAFHEFSSNALRYAVQPTSLGFGSDTDSTEVRFGEAAAVLNSAAYRYALNYTFDLANPSCFFNVTPNESNGNIRFDLSGCPIPMILPSAGVRNYLCCLLLAWRRLIVLPFLRSSCRPTGVMFRSDLARSWKWLPLSCP